MTTTPKSPSADQLRATVGEQLVPCADQPELFFEPDGDNSDCEPPAARVLRERSARTLCLSCPVRLLCLELARVEQPEYGIWGGFTASEIRNGLKSAA